MSKYKLNKVVLLTKEMRSNENIRDQWTVDAREKQHWSRGIRECDLET